MFKTSFGQQRIQKKREKRERKIEERERERAGSDTQNQ